MKKRIIFLSPKLDSSSGGEFRVKDNLTFLKKHFCVKEVWVKNKNEFNSIFEYLKYLMKIKKKLKNNIVFMEFPKYGFLIPLNSKLIYSAHNFETSLRYELLKKNKNIKSLVNFLFWSISEFYTILRAKIVITITERLKKQISKFRKNEVYELFPKITNKAQSNLNIENKYFFLGSFQWYPNYEAYKYFVEKILPYLAKYYKKEIEFYFIGRGNNLFEDFMVKNIKIKHIDFINNLEFLKNFKGSIIPIKTGSGLKIKLLDSIMYGKIPISTLKGLEGMEKYQSYFLVFNNEKEFLELLLKLDNKNTYDKHIKNLHKLIKELQNKRVVQEKNILVKVLEL